MRFWNSVFGNSDNNDHHEQDGSNHRDKGTAKGFGRLFSQSTKKKGPLQTRKLQIEQFEARELLSIDGPQLNSVFINQDQTRSLSDESLLHIAPTSFLLRFSEGQVIDPTSLGGIQVYRSGGDGVFANDTSGINSIPDIPVVIGYIGVGDYDNEVIIRFAENLPADLYQIRLIGGGDMSTPTDLNNPNILKSVYPDGTKESFYNSSPESQYKDSTDIQTVRFDLRLGAKVTSVVTQPTFRNPNGTLGQSRNTIEVYFNQEIVAPAKELFQLIATQNTLDPGDDKVIIPQSVSYNAATKCATLTFEKDLADYGNGAFRLRLGEHYYDTHTQTLDLIDKQDEIGDTFKTAYTIDLADFNTALSNPQSLIIHSQINREYDPVEYPGGRDSAGHRDLPRFFGFDNDNHLGGDKTTDKDTESGPTIFYYNFKDILGVNPKGGYFRNSISDAQKELARIIFDMYSRYLGVQFIETADMGITVATGDLAWIDTSISGFSNPGISGELLKGRSNGSDRAIMDGSKNWGANVYGGAWFDTAFHEIGHCLGFNDAYDLMPGTMMGTGIEDYSRTDDGNNLIWDAATGTYKVNIEKTYPGIEDILHGMNKYRPDSTDVDMYEFTLKQGGTFSAEVFAQRATAASQLDVQLKIYQQIRYPNGFVTYELVAQNDDYFGKDAFIELYLPEGTYYVAVTSTGNDDINPQMNNTGGGGRTVGNYELRLNFSANGIDRDNPNTFKGAPANFIVDKYGIKLDGDDDMVPGGAYNFWFNVQQRTNTPVTTDIAQINRTLFVDNSGRLYNADGTAVAIDPNQTRDPALVGDGTMANPFKTIKNALERAAEIQQQLEAYAKANPLQKIDTTVVVRIVGNNLGGNIKNTKAYEIGVNTVTRASLTDGATFDIPKGVSVVIDAGVVIKMGDANITVGSSDLNIDRSGGSLQILGTPQHQVYFTSYFDETIGRDTYPLPTTPKPGDWGGIVIRNDIDYEFIDNYNASTNRERREVLEKQGIFLNYVNNSVLVYGGGSKNDFIYQPIHIIDARPTVTYNTITISAQAAMSATPRSFEETRYQNWDHLAPFTTDIVRIGPHIHGNTLVSNSMNGLLVDAKTPVNTSLVQKVDVAARFNNLDIVHILTENLIISGPTGGNILSEATAPSLNLTSQILSELGDDRANTRSDVYLDQRLTIVGHRNAFGVYVPRPADAEYFSLTDGETKVTFEYNIVDVVGQGYSNANRVQAGRVAIDILSDDPIEEVIRKTMDAINAVNKNEEKYDSATGRPMYLLANQRLTPNQFKITAVPDPDKHAGSLALFGTGLRVDIDGVGLIKSRDAGSLTVSPGVIVKSNNSRIELEYGAQLLAEGTVNQPIVFTSLYDNRFGVGGTFNTSSRADGMVVGAAAPGNWAGIVQFPNSNLSLDNVVFAYAGGSSRIEGQLTRFNPIEIREADARITNSRFEFNMGNRQGDQITDRAGRGMITPSVIYVRGAQPIIIGNDFFANDNGIRDSKLSLSVISINANSFTDQNIVDRGRSTGNIDRHIQFDDNFGPLVRDNTYTNNALNGMVVRGEILTTASVWDDTDIVHVLFNEIVIPNFHHTGGLRLTSDYGNSLVVKLLTDNSVTINSDRSQAGISTTGTPLEISDRIGGAMQVVGVPGYPVIFTSLKDDSVGAGFDLRGQVAYDTNNTARKIEGWVNGQWVGGEMIGGQWYAAGSWYDPSVPRPGDWRSIKFERYSHDRNVVVIREFEKDKDLEDSNNTPAKAQFLGYLAPNMKSGDDVKRLGFEVHGSIRANDPSDADVFSFTADAGTEVWIDITHTGRGLDTIIEIIDVDGNVLASSDNSFFEGPDTFGRYINRVYDHDFDPAKGDHGNTIGFNGGINAFPLNKDSWQRVAIDATQNNPWGPEYSYNGVGYNKPGSTNTRDAGLRYVCEGSGEKTYFVRIRSVLSISWANSITRATSHGKEFYIEDTKGQRITYRFDFDKVGFEANSTKREVIIGLAGVTPNDYAETIAAAINSNESFIANRNLDVRAAMSRYSLTDPNPVITLNGVGLFFNPRESGLVVQENSTGSYQLQIRLQETPEVAGCSVAYADIRYAINGVEAYGFPQHSMILGEVQLGNGHTSFSTAQPLGNLLQSDRNAISVAGYLSSLNDVNWYTFDMELAGIQNIAHVSDGTALWSTIFDIDYADALARPDLSLWVFDSAGRLIYMGTDSNVADDRPGPTGTRAGASYPEGTITKLSAGSVGGNDPFIGPAILQSNVAGSPKQVYFIAVTSKYVVPNAIGSVLNVGQANNAGTRIEPIDTITRLIDEHVNGGQNFGWSSNVEVAQRLVLTPDEYHIGDVPMYIAYGGSIGMYNPTTGALILQPSGNVRPGNNGADITMGPYGRLIGTYTSGIDFYYQNISPVTLGSNLTDPINTHIHPYVPGDGNPPPPVLASGGGYFMNAISHYPASSNATRVSEVNLWAGQGSNNQSSFMVVIGNMPGASTFGTNRVTTNVNVMYFLDNTGKVIHLPWASDGLARYFSDAVPWATFQNTSDGVNQNLFQTSGELITAVTFSADGRDLYVGTNTGAVYQIHRWNESAYSAVNPPNAPPTIVRNSNPGPQLEFIGYLMEDNGNVLTNLSSFTIAPQTVEGGAFSHLFYATTGDGQMFAFDMEKFKRLNSYTGPDGQRVPLEPGAGAISATHNLIGRRESMLEPIFVNGSKVPRIPAGARGICFSPVDYNLWHRTGVTADPVWQSPSLIRANKEFDHPIEQEQPAGSGGTSWYFGIQGGTSAPTYQVDAFPNNWMTSQSGLTGFNQGLPIAGSYDVPGGTYGGLTSNAFSLADYTAEDKPMLYFSYRADTENWSLNSYGDDSIAVYISTDGNNWERVSTTNYDMNRGSNVGDSNWQNPYNYVDMVADDQWRQARVDLSRYAGQKNVQLKFFFSTTGGEVGYGYVEHGGTQFIGVPASQLFDVRNFNAGEVARLPDGSKYSGFIPGKITLSQLMNLANFDVRSDAGFVLGDFGDYSTYTGTLSNLSQATLGTAIVYEYQQGWSLYVPTAPGAQGQAELDDYFVITSVTGTIRTIRFGDLVNNDLNLLRKLNSEEFMTRLINQINSVFGNNVNAYRYTQNGGPVSALNPYVGQQMYFEGVADIRVVGNSASIPLSNSSIRHTQFVVTGGAQNDIIGEISRMSNNELLRWLEDRTRVATGIIDIVNRMNNTVPIPIRGDMTAEEVAATVTFMVNLTTNQGLKDYLRTYANDKYGSAWETLDFFFNFQGALTQLRRDRITNVTQIWVNGPNGPQIAADTILMDGETWIERATGEYWAVMNNRAIHPDYSEIFVAPGHSLSQVNLGEYNNIFRYRDVASFELAPLRPGQNSDTIEFRENILRITVWDNTDNVIVFQREVQAGAGDYLYFEPDTPTSTWYNTYLVRGDTGSRVNLGSQYRFEVRADGRDTLRPVEKFTEVIYLSENGGRMSLPVSNNASYPRSYVLVNQTRNSGAAAQGGWVKEDDIVKIGSETTDPRTGRRTADIIQIIRHTGEFDHLVPNDANGNLVNLGVHYVDRVIHYNAGGAANIWSEYASVEGEWINVLDAGNVFRYSNAGYRDIAVSTGQFVDRVISTNTNSVQFTWQTDTGFTSEGYDLIPGVNYRAVNNGDGTWTIQRLTNRHEVTLFNPEDRFSESVPGTFTWGGSLSYNDLREGQIRYDQDHDRDASTATIWREVARREILSGEIFGEIRTREENGMFIFEWDIPGGGTGTQPYPLSEGVTYYAERNTDDSLTLWQKTNHRTLTLNEGDDFNFTIAGTSIIYTWGGSFVATGLNHEYETVGTTVTVREVTNEITVTPETGGVQRVEGNTEMVSFYQYQWDVNYTVSGSNTRGAVMSRVIVEYPGTVHTFSVEVSSGMRHAIEGNQVVRYSSTGVRTVEHTILEGGTVRREVAVVTLNAEGNATATHRTFTEITQVNRVNHNGNSNAVQLVDENGNTFVVFCSGANPIQVYRGIHLVSYDRVYDNGELRVDYEAFATPNVTNSWTIYKKTWLEQVTLRLGERAEVRQMAYLYEDRNDNGAIDAIRVAGLSGNLQTGYLRGGEIVSQPAILGGFFDVTGGFLMGYEKFADQIRLVNIDADGNSTTLGEFDVYVVNDPNYRYSTRTVTTQYGAVPCAYTYPKIAGEFTYYKTGNQVALIVVYIDDDGNVVEVRELTRTNDYAGDNEYKEGLFTERRVGGYNPKNLVDLFQVFVVRNGVTTTIPNTQILERTMRLDTTRNIDEGYVQTYHGGPYIPPVYGPGTTAQMSLIGKSVLWYTPQEGTLAGFYQIRQDVIEGIWNESLTTKAGGMNVQISELMNKSYLSSSTPYSPSGNDGYFGYFSLGSGQNIARRANDNKNIGIFIDNIIIGVAGRGEMVTNAPVNTTGFTYLVDHSFGEAPYIGGRIPKDATPHGAYQLEIRRGAENITYIRPEYNTNPEVGRNAHPLSPIHPNERLTNGITLVTPNLWEVYHGQKFSLTDGVNKVEFVFFAEHLIKGAGDAVQIIFSQWDSQATLARKIVDAINGAYFAGRFNVTASEYTNPTLIDLFGAVDFKNGGLLSLPLDALPGTEAYEDWLFRNGENGRPIKHIFYGQQYFVPVFEYNGATAAYGYNQNVQTSDLLLFLDPTQTQYSRLYIDRATMLGKRIGDENAKREQGQLNIFGSSITNSREYGVRLEPGRREMDIPGGPTNPGGVMNQQNPAIFRGTNDITSQVTQNGNTTNFVPGVAVVNNIFAFNGLGGIYLSGQRVTGRNPDGTPASFDTLDPQGPVPFVRIVNNTFYGSLPDVYGHYTGAGIIVGPHASPTIMNNIFANLSFGVAIHDSSRSTVLLANAYQNITNLDVSIINSEFDKVLGQNEPLFVAPEARNFYLRQGSRAIDIGTTSLPERIEWYSSYISALGIPQSTIFAPTTDIYGQVRKADETTTSGGTGANAYIDMGAVDRVDIYKPTSYLVNPQDRMRPEDVGDDLNSDPHDVFLVDQRLMNFVIQLSDIGIGIDNLSVADPRGKVYPHIVTILEQTWDIEKQELIIRRLVLDRDYFADYNASNNQIFLTPTRGRWNSNATYTILINNDSVQKWDLAFPAGNVYSSIPTETTENGDKARYFKLWINGDLIAIDTIDFTTTDELAQAIIDTLAQRQLTGSDGGIVTAQTIMDASGKIIGVTFNQAPYLQCDNHAFTVSSSQENGTWDVRLPANLLSVFMTPSPLVFNFDGTVVSIAVNEITDRTPQGLIDAIAEALADQEVFGADGSFVTVEAITDAFGTITGFTFRHVQVLQCYDPAFTIAKREAGMTRVQNGIRDLAGNPLDWNRASGLTRFEVVLSGYNYGDAGYTMVNGVRVDYPTLYNPSNTNAYARHIVWNGYSLGYGIIVDTDGRPNQHDTLADGTQLHGNRYDDGVIGDVLIPGKYVDFTFNITAVNIPPDFIRDNPVDYAAGYVGYINAFFDWQRNGNWNNADNQVRWMDETGKEHTGAIPVKAGSNTIKIFVPAEFTNDKGQKEKLEDGEIWARFRFSSEKNLKATGPGPDGKDPNGEVEDYKFDVALHPKAFGSAPQGVFNDPFTGQPRNYNYPVKLDRDGAWHATDMKYGYRGTTPVRYDASDDESLITNGGALYFGTAAPLATPDGWPGIPSVQEDGINLQNTLFVAGQTSQVKVQIHVPVALKDYLNANRNESIWVEAWFDFQNKGTWDSNATYISKRIQYADLANLGADGMLTVTLEVAVPQNAAIEKGISFARFRINSIGQLGATGYKGPVQGEPAIDGEVQDVMIFVMPYGTNWQTDFGTSTNYGTAVHKVVNGPDGKVIQLGYRNNVQFDPIRFPSIVSSILDDNDGVTFPSFTVGNQNYDSVLFSDRESIITINASHAGYVSIWVDLNGDGYYSESERLTDINGNMYFQVQAGINEVPVNLNTKVSGRLQTQTRIRYTDLTVNHTLLTATNTEKDIVANGEVEDYRVTLLGTSSSISGRVYNDFNGNGRLDANETGLGGVTIVLRDESRREVARTTSNTYGYYEFVGLYPGNYYVEQLPIPNASGKSWIQTSPSGSYYYVELRESEDSFRNHFGNFLPGTVSLGDAEIVEGSGGGYTTVRVPVYLTDSFGAAVQVEVETMDGTAIAGHDYVKSKATYTFPSNVTNPQGTWDIQRVSSGLGETGQYDSSVSGRVMAYAAKIGNTYQVMLESLDDPTGVFVLTNSTRDSLYPQVLHDKETGLVHVVWSSFNGKTYDLYYTYGDSTNLATLQANIVKLTNDPVTVPQGLNNLSPQVSKDAKGDIHVAWLAQYPQNFANPEYAGKSFILTQKVNASTLANGLCGDVVMASGTSHQPYLGYVNDLHLDGSTVAWTTAYEEMAYYYSMYGSTLRPVTVTEVWASVNTSRGRLTQMVSEPHDFYYITSGGERYIYFYDSDGVVVYQNLRMNNGLAVWEMQSGAGTSLVQEIVLCNPSAQWTNSFGQMQIGKRLKIGQTDLYMTSPDVNEKWVVWQAETKTQTIPGTSTSTYDIYALNLENFDWDSFGQKTQLIDDHDVDYAYYRNNRLISLAIESSLDLELGILNNNTVELSLTFASVALFEEYLRIFGNSTTNVKEAIIDGTVLRDLDVSMAGLENIVFNGLISATVTITSPGTMPYPGYPTRPPLDNAGPLQFVVFNGVIGPDAQVNIQAQRLQTLYVYGLTGELNVETTNLKNLVTGAIIATENRGLISRGDVIFSGGTIEGELNITSGALAQHGYYYDYPTLDSIVNYGNILSSAMFNCAIEYVFPDIDYTYIMPMWRYDTFVNLGAAKSNDLFLNSGVRSIIAYETSSAQEIASLPAVAENSQVIVKLALGNSAFTRVSTQNYSGNINVAPRVSGSQVVWRSSNMSTYGGGDQWGVFGVDLANPLSRPTLISQSNYSAWAPQVSEDRVVWRAQVGSNYQVFSATYQPAFLEGFVTFQIMADNIIEPDEYFLVKITSASIVLGAGSLIEINPEDVIGKKDTGYVWILNDDGAMNYGNLPNTYSTLLASNGARHGVSGADPLALYDPRRPGIPIHVAQNGTPNNTATSVHGDKQGVVFGTYDERNRIVESPWIPGQQATITVTVTEECYLNAFVDWNGNGQFGVRNLAADPNVPSGLATYDPDERLELLFDAKELLSDKGYKLSPGVNVITFTVPRHAKAVTAGARFRVSSEGGLHYFGYAADGEVEDYVVNIQSANTNPVRRVPGTNSVIVSGSVLRDELVIYHSNPDPKYLGQLTIQLNGTMYTAKDLGMEKIDNIFFDGVYGSDVVTVYGKNTSSYNVTMTPYTTNPNELGVLIVETDLTIRLTNAPNMTFDGGSPQGNIATLNDYLGGASLVMRPNYAQMSGMNYTYTVLNTEEIHAYSSVSTSTVSMYGSTQNGDDFLLMDRKARLTNASKTFTNTATGFGNVQVFNLGGTGNKATIDVSNVAKNEVHFSRGQQPLGNVLDIGVFNNGGSKTSQISVYGFDSQKVESNPASFNSEVYILGTPQNEFLYGAKLPGTNNNQVKLFAWNANPATDDAILELLAYNSAKSITAKSVGTTANKAQVIGDVLASLDLEGPWDQM